MSDQQSSQTSRAALIVLLKAHRSTLSLAQKSKRKKPVRWLYPWATEHHYTQSYRAWLKPVKDFVNDFLDTHQEAILNGDGADAVIRADAVAGESFRLMVQSLNNWVGAYISDDEQKKLRSPIFLGLGDIAENTFNFNGKQYEKSVQSALGVSFPSDEAWWINARKMWQDTNYEIIRSDIKKHIADINSATEQAVVNGWSVKTLREKILALDHKITKSRAAFIARDQIGKLNGTITQKRMQDIGLELYVWSGSSDERERESHVAMNNKLCRWDDATVYSDDGGKTWKNRADIGGVLKHPGMDYQCRCCALAYFDELIDEADGVTGGGVQSNTENPKSQESELLSLNSLKKDDKKTVSEDLKKIQPEQLKLLTAKAKDMKADFYNSAAYCDSKKIYLDIMNVDERSKALGYNTNITTFLHESGHWLDYNMLGNGEKIRDKLPDLRKKLKADALNYCNNLLQLEKPLKSIKDLTDSWKVSNAIINDLKLDKYKKNGVSDIFCGLTKTEIAGQYGHWTKSYWKGEALEAEAIAHFFEARGSSSEKLNILKQYFPTAYEYFDTFIRSIV